MLGIADHNEIIRVEASEESSFSCKFIALRGSNVEKRRAGGKPIVKFAVIFNATTSPRLQATSPTPHDRFRLG
jgi:hypothetical protein